MDLGERFAFLAVSSIFFQYPKIGAALITHAGSARKVFEGDRNRFIHLFNNNRQLFDFYKLFNDWVKIEKNFEYMQKNGIDIIVLGDSRYPKLLSEIVDPPPLFTIKGEGKKLLNAPCVGIVGARKARPSALDKAAEIAEFLADKGYCVVSGLAYGIDTAAHKGAVSSSGETIAVFGCGIDTIYPSSNVWLSEKIVQKGLLLSEFPVGTIPMPRNFPQRNRIISGLSLGVIIVQAAVASGSLITARFALEQGREVFSVPGEGGHPSCGGSNRLIRDGSMLIESGEDVFEILEKERLKYPFLEKSGHSYPDVDKGSPLLQFFPDKGSVSFDSLFSRSKMELPDFLRELTSLSLSGAIEELSGRRYRIT
jgi:DNA processing protein